MIQEESKALGPEKAINPHVRIMAKLENEEAIKDLNKILEISDAILVPRG